MTERKAGDERDVSRITHKLGNAISITVLLGVILIGWLIWKLLT